VVLLECNEVSVINYYIARIFVSQRGQLIKSAVILGISIIGLTFLYIFNPSGSIFYAPCPFHALTGFHCPGCGTLRGLNQLLHGHIGAAFGLNPLMVVLLPFLGFSLLSYIIAGISGRRLPNVFIPASFIWGLLGFIILFWILRNIPFYPFSLLAP